MSFASFSIKHKVFVNMLTIIVIITGLMTALKMRREVFPKITVDYVFVQTIYPGASPREVEKLVTIPIEDALQNIDGIDTYNSSSSENFSFLFIELEPNLANRDRVINEIAREVDKVDLPEDAEDPETKEFVLEDPIIEIAFSGKDVSENELRNYLKIFENTIKNIKGIGSVERVGFRDKEVWIEVDPNNLEKYYISLIQVIQSISNQDLNLPGGKLTSGSKELIIRTMGEINTPKEFYDVIIRTNSDGKYLCIKDVASIKDGFEEESRIYKTNGKISINLIAKKKKTADVIKLVDAIKEEVKKYKKTLPKNISVELLNDTAFYVKRRLKVLTSNGIVGLALLVLCLLVFLNVRVALVTALGIPFAFMAALLFMSFFDVTLNLITMFGLIIVLGMIVDDAIVVSENAYRYMEQGLSPLDATIKGTNEVIAPVTATILTTAAAFAPLMFIPGIMGKFLKFFPMGVLFCLAASLFEAAVILPCHLAEWIRPLKTKQELGIPEKHSCEIKYNSKLGKILCSPLILFSALKHYITSHERKGSEAKWFQAALNKYTKILKFSVNNRYKLGIILIFVLIASVIFSVKIMPFKLFPDMIEIFYVRIEKPEGSTLKQTNESLSLIEDIILKTLSENELDNLTATVGFSGELGGGPLDKYESKYAQCIVYLTPEKERKRKANEIIPDLRKKIEALKIPDLVNLEFEKVHGGPPVGKPVSIDVKGDDFEGLIKIKEKIKSYLKTIDGIEDIKDNYELGKEEIQVYINKKEAARLGLDVRTVAATIRFAFEGGVATTMRKGDEDIDVIVKLPEHSKESISTLKNLTIPNNQGRLIKLYQVGYFKKEQGLKNISHKDGKRVINITAGVNEKKLTSVAANKIIIEHYKNFNEKHPGYLFKCGGEWEDTTESIQGIVKAFIIAFILIYMILASQFKSFIQPIIILTSVPFGIIGVIFALFLHGQPMSLMALFGSVGLTGVVVNDALILVDFINKRKEAGLSTIESAIDAGRTRFRPIILTSFTTIMVHSY